MEIIESYGQDQSPCRIFLMWVLCRELRCQMLHDDDYFQVDVLVFVYIVIIYAVYVNFKVPSCVVDGFLCARGASRWPQINAWRGAENTTIA